jgi:UDP-3-O-[3-hydroxymyristoyl] glucosamine N-acyltransferase
MRTSLKDISKLIGASYKGSNKKEIIGINTLELAKSNQISYAVSSKHLKSFSNSKAGAIIIDNKLKAYCSSKTLLVDDAYLAFAKLSHYFKKYQVIIDDNGIKLNINKIRSIKGVFVGPGCFIGNNVVVGENTNIGSNCVIEDGVSIGENSHIFANVVIHKNCQIGKSCVISSGVIIGSEGFGNAITDNKTWLAIAHLGNVYIGNNVSIGANTTIDRGTINNTEIHNGVKIDNLVHLAHNVIIGENTAIAAKTGIAGTTIIGKRCMIGGMVGIVGHLSITDDVIVNATSTVNRSIKKSGIYTGFVPIMPHSEWKKVGLWITKLDKIVTTLKIKLHQLKKNL